MILSSLNTTLPKCFVDTTQLSLYKSQCSPSRNRRTSTFSWLWCSPRAKIFNIPKWIGRL